MYPEMADCFVIDSAGFVLGRSRNLHSAGVKSDNEKCPFRGRASVVVSVAAIIHSCVGFVCFLSHDYINAGDCLGGVIPASGINSGAAILHSRAGFIGALSRLYSRLGWPGRGYSRQRDKFGSRHFTLTRGFDRYSLTLIFTPAGVAVGA